MLTQANNAENESAFGRFLKIFTCHVGLINKCLANGTWLRNSPEE